VTANSIIRRALRLLGVTASTPTANDAAYALEALNAMLAAWSVQRLIPEGRVSATYNTVGAQASYTVHPAGDWAGVTPKVIVSAEMVGTLSDTPIVALTAEQYQSIPHKAWTGDTIEKYWYNRSGTTGTFYIYPVPAAASQVRLTYLPVYSTLALTTTIPLPDEYEEALAYNLAVKYGSEYGGNAVPAAVATLAQDALADIQRMNLRVPRMTVDSTLTRTAPYDIWRGA